MTEQNLGGRDGLHPTRRFLPLLLLLFVGSGCAALIYEIVWFQLLQVVVGSSAVSLGVLLGTFMGGMCLGSFALPRLIGTRQHPLRVYALLEVGIGLVGILELWAIPSISQLYLAIVGHGMPGILLRGIICAICLLPPTVLMGATLPAMARWVETTPKGVSWLGFFYGGNIGGAVFGCLFAGFYLLRVHDIATATFVAAAVNGAVALIGLGLASLTLHREPPTVRIQDRATVTAGSWAVYAAIALSGLCALGSEVVWTRLLSLMLGGTVYTFSIILAVFLVGLGIGSSVGSFLSRTTAQPRVALGWCQILLTAAIAWTAWMITKSIPYWPINPSLSWNPWINFQVDLVRCLWAILPPAILWGASFPLALAAIVTRGQDPGRLVGGVYAANTVGAILGALILSMLLIPWFGTQISQRVLIGLSAVAAALAFAPLARSGGTDEADTPKRGTDMLQSAGVALLLMAAIGVAAFFIWSVPPVPSALVAHGRYLPTSGTNEDILFLGEGMNSSVAVSELRESGVRNFHVSGKVEASSEPQDMRLQRMLGHIPALVHPKPRSVLVVGCGAGVTAGSFVVHPDIERIVICEIEPLIPKVVAQYFKAENHNVLEDPRLTVVYDDGRHYILTTQEKFDIITSDPIHPWVKGAATLYTKEYFELCRHHLNPGGIITQWVPLYESSAAAVKSEMATFFEVFPNGMIFVNGEGYDVVLIGWADTPRINVDELERRLSRVNHQSVNSSLSDVGFKSGTDLLKTYGGRGADLAPWLKDAEINRDRNLRLQYLAGMGLNLDQGFQIFEDMLAFRRFPEGEFVASSERKAILRKALEPKKSDK